MLWNQRVTIAQVIKGHIPGDGISVLPFEQHMIYFLQTDYDPYIKPASGHWSSPQLEVITYHNIALRKNWQGYRGCARSEFT